MEIKKKIKIINFIIIPIVFSKIIYSYYYFNKINTYEKLIFFFLLTVIICFLFFPNILIYYLGSIMINYSFLIFFNNKNLYFNFICIYLLIFAITTNILFKQCLLSSKKYLPIFSELHNKLLMIINFYIKKYNFPKFKITTIQYGMSLTAFSIKLLLIYNKYI